MWQLGENPDPKIKGHGKVRGPFKWLRIDPSERTSWVLDEFRLSSKVKALTQRSGSAKARAKKALQRAYVPQVRARVSRWQHEIESGGESRAGIAKREGLSRARVTQLMRLLGLPSELKHRIISEPKLFQNMSIRQALHLADDQ